MDGTELLLRAKYAPDTLPASVHKSLHKTDFHSGSVYPHGTSFDDLQSLVQTARAVQEARGDSQQIYLFMLERMTAQHLNTEV